MVKVEPACGDSCVSVAIVTGTFRTSSLSLSLIEVRDPIQIRWASSDLSVLETHPLTPGLWLNHPTTINPIVPPRGLYTVGLGLAFLPLILACGFAAIFGPLLIYRKAHLQRKQRTQPVALSTRDYFRPRIFSWVTFLLLVAFLISAIILLELSCHILPPANSDIQLRDFAVTKTYISDTVIIRQQEANTTATLLPAMTCAVTGSFEVSEFLTQYVLPKQSVIIY
jgi:hypothetical protein